MEVTAEQRPARSDGRLVAWLVFVGGLTALNFASRFAPADADDRREAVYNWAFAIGGAVQFGVMLLLTLWIAGRPGRQELLGLRSPRSWPSALGLVLASLVAVYAAAALLEPVLHAGEEQGLTPEGWDADRAAPFFANAAVIVLLAPLVEELLFRGLGFALLLRFGRTVAILGSGMAFGLAHGLVGGFVILAAFGIVLSWLRARTESVLPCIILHSIFNALALLAAVLVGDDS
jgi:membrane protease YdiL (CAAX protease family)